MFTEDQKAELVAKLDGAKVKTRSQAGQTLSYVEGWVVIAEANRIFGFDGWSRETVETRCVWEGTRTSRQGKELLTASYTAKVRVTVLAGDIKVVREGTGAGSGMGTDGGEAHESAIKEAETDAMKRAFMTFGNPFGLALYDKTQADVDRGPPAPPPQRPGPRSVERGTPLRDAREEIQNGTASTVPQGKPADGPPTTPREWALSKYAYEFCVRARTDLSTVNDGARLSDWMAEFKWEHDAIIEHANDKRREHLNESIADAQDRCRAPVNLRAAG